MPPCNLCENKSFCVSNLRNHININHIPQDFNLDLLMEGTNAPGLSAFNKAERRMYHLRYYLRMFHNIDNASSN